MRQMLRDQFTAQTIRSNLLYLFIYFLLGESVTVWFGTVRLEKISTFLLRYLHHWCLCVICCCLQYYIYIYTYIYSKLVWVWFLLAILSCLALKHFKTIAVVSPDSNMSSIQTCTVVPEGFFLNLNPAYNKKTETKNRVLWVIFEIS